MGFYLYRFGDRDLPFSKQELAVTLGMGWNSLSLKVANFRALDGKGSMDGYTTQTIRVYERYKNTPDDEFRLVAEEAMRRRIAARLKQVNEVLDRAGKRSA